MTKHSNLTAQVAVDDDQQRSNSGTAIDKTKSAVWRKTVSAGLVVASLAFLLNVGVLIWAKRRVQNVQGVAIASTGICGEQKRTIFWLNLAVNIVSTLLLSTCNNCAQLLSSPTRADIQQAHGQGHWMDIGIPSVRNLRYIPRWRVCLWVVILASSVPLHLLYNSVFSATVPNEKSWHYSRTVVTEEFTRGGWWNQTTYSNYYDLPRLQAIIPSLVKMENAACVKAYQPGGATNVDYPANGKTFSLDGTRGYVWGSLIVVSSIKQTDGVLGTMSKSWVCTDHNFVPDFNVCNFQIPASSQNASMWTVKNLCQAAYCSDQYSAIEAAMLYCLAEPMQPKCSVLINTTLLAVVVGFNFLKIVCLAGIIFYRNFEPLATIGDAIDSFLRDPELLTQNLGPISIFTVKQQSKFLLDPSTARPGTLYKLGKRRWAHAVSLSRWLLCLISCGIVWFTALSLLIFIMVDFYLPSDALPTTSFGPSEDTLDANHISLFPGGEPFIPDLLVANLPQLLISLVALSINSVYTSMVQAHEYSAFSSTRKPLRVSDPADSQRSTFWLQLPYQYILPLMALMAVLHWLVSNSIFVIEDVVSQNGSPGDSGFLAMSPSAIFISLIAGLVLVTTLVGVSFRKLDPGMPIIRSCSFAISAACHPDPDEGDLASLPLMYGVLDAGRRDEQGRQRVGFSSKPVVPLEDGVTYI